MAFQTLNPTRGKQSVKIVISVARDFSRTPGPRYINQGDWSGEKFMRQLIRALAENETIVVDLDGTRGYGSSFLDEAFGGLIREGHMTRADVLRRIDIRSDEDPSYREEALQGISKAQPRN